MFGSCWRTYNAIVLVISNKSEFLFSLVFLFLGVLSETLIIVCSYIADTSVLNISDIWIS